LDGEAAPKVGDTRASWKSLAVKCEK